MSGAVGRDRASQTFLGRSILSTFYKLMSFTRGRRWLLAAGLICAVGLTLATIGIPLLVGWAIDQALGSEEGVSAEPGLLLPLVGGILGLAVLRFLFSFGRRYATNYLGHVVEYRMRKSLFQKMLDLPHGFYDKLRDRGTSLAGDQRPAGNKVFRRLGYVPVVYKPPDAGGRRGRDVLHKTLRWRR